MLWELLKFALTWAGFIMVSTAILIVLGAFCMGGFDGHKLSKPSAQRKPDSNASQTQTQSSNVSSNRRR
jgi:hypothetical protein